MRVTTPLVVRGLAAAFVVLACCAPPALAGWSADPVTVTPTSSAIPLVEGCADGSYGVFVAWQEGSPTGVLRVQHLLATGVLDPTWPAAGASACNIVAARTELAALPDRLGGVYLLWKENTTLYATRIDPAGAVAAGWPARGRALGAVLAASPRPSVIEDGENGFSAAWTNGSQVGIAIHLGPANTGAGGWPNSPRAIGPFVDYYETMYWPQLALAPDGGVFVAWASATSDEEVTPSAWRLRRLDSAGLNAPGWPEEGLGFGAFHREVLGSTAKGSLVAVCPDGRGGAFLMIGNPVGPDPYGYGAAIENRLHRVQGDGLAAPDWPAGGLVLWTPPGNYHQDQAGAHPDYSYALRGSAEGALVGAPVYYSEFITTFGLAEYQETWPGTQGNLVGHELADAGDGGQFLASFSPSTEPYYYGDVAGIGIRRTPSAQGWKGWSESHSGEYGTWYGDIGLAATGDGGAVLLWSQVRESIGLFARRFNPAGQVTAVEPAPPPTPSLSRLRFVPGLGVTATILLGSAEPARFELYDVAGRRIASQPVELVLMPAMDAPPEFTLAGTARLPSGLYFGRLRVGATAVSGKVVVAR